jgi:hypothetical protein
MKRNDDMMSLMWYCGLPWWKRKMWDLRRFINRWFV